MGRESSRIPWPFSLLTGKTVLGALLSLHSFMPSSCSAQKQGLYRAPWTGAAFLDFRFLTCFPASSIRCTNAKCLLQGTHAH